MVQYWLGSGETTQMDELTAERERAKDVTPMHIYLWRKLEKRRKELAYVESDEAEIMLGKFRRAFMRERLKEELRELSDDLLNIKNLDVEDHSAASMPDD